MQKLVFGQRAELGPLRGAFSPQYLPAGQLRAFCVRQCGLMKDPTICFFLFGLGFLEPDRSPLASYVTYVTLDMCAPLKALVSTFVKCRLTIISPLQCGCIRG